MLGPAAKQIEPMLVDAAQIAAPQRDPWRSKNSRIWIATLRPCRGTVPR
jgi:hypothetical protein